MKRVGPGFYTRGRYNVERGWGDDGPDRRRQVWVVYRLDDDMTADILSEHRTYRDARIEVQRLEQADEG